MEKRDIETSVVGIPTTKNGVNAASGCNTNSQNDFLAETKSAILARVKTFLWTNIKNLVSEKSEEAEAKTGNETSSFELAAAVAIYSDTNLVTARMGNPDGDQKADIKANGSITVLARAESQPYIIAIATVKETEDTPAPPAGGDGTPAGASEDETGVKFAGSAAVAIGMFTNEAISYIGSGSAVDAAQKLTVKAEAVNDYEFDYGEDIVEVWTSTECRKSIPNRAIMDVLES